MSWMERRKSPVYLSRFTRSSMSFSWLITRPPEWRSGMLTMANGCGAVWVDSFGGKEAETDKVFVGVVIRF